MLAAVAFTGFRPDLLEFLRGLRDNNSREWFQAHRAEYDTLLMQPGREPVIASIGQFQRFAPIQQWLVDLLAD